jgi:FAD synthase
VHILNFTGDLCNKNITIVTDRFLRLPKKFNNPADLIAQMAVDLKRAQE